MSRILLPLFLLFIPTLPAFAQQEKPTADLRVQNIVGSVSPDRIRADIEKLVSFGTRHTLSDTSDPRRGIGAARKWIFSEFERSAAASHGRMTVAFDEFSEPPSARVPRPTNIVNVVATLRPFPTTGTSDGRTIVVSGHYDSRATDVMDATSDAPGADDDGSGTALVLELARVFSTADVRATVVFICYAGEEQGLYGSTHRAAMAAQVGARIEAVLNNDIVGGDHGGDGQVDSETVRVFSAAMNPADTGAALNRVNSLGLENDGPSRSLARYCKEIGERYVPGFSVRLVYRGDRFLRGGDQLPFHQKGFAAVRFSESKEDFNHQHQNVRDEGGVRHGDLPGFVNERYCANIARINAAVAASLAFSPPPPAHAVMILKGLAYGTDLRWSKNAGKDVAGYLIRWRDTSSPVWQHSAFTPDTTISLAAGKDDYLFGVQSVSTAGDPSLYSIPLPAR